MMGGNMSFQALRELISQTADGSGQFADSSGKVVTKKFVYHEPASKKSFEDLSSQEFRIPMELHQLLDISNGFEIYNFEGVDGYRIFGTSDLPAINKLISGSYDDQWDNRFLIFAECIGDGSYLALKRTDDGGEVVDCFLEVNPSEWNTVSHSVSAFFIQLIKSNGQKFWLENSR